ncbi:hypothetical protein BGZ65_002712 [Modicella reniformis]|uniref:LYC1 C-terminal domain-containing protein n=1 Tax=Modicella reniformis TaxID=1440133 RepID=A0A9P6M9K0_9FUNG|nr:hypothetical protein BGZ65_002712 [Modicella reniformis]
MVAESTASGQSKGAAAATAATAAPFSHCDIHLIRTLSPEIIQHTWINNKEEWGKSMDLETYLSRERYLNDQTLARDGKLKTWVLVPKSFDPEHPDLLLRRLIVLESLVPKIKVCKMCSASVLARRLWDEISRMDNVSFTLLHSDIGPTFYSRFGWIAQRSDEIAIPTSYTIVVDSNSHQDPVSLENIGDSNMQDVTTLDIQLLRESLKAQLEESTNSDKLLFAVIPDIHCIQWINARAKYYVQHVLKQDQHDITVLGVKDLHSDSFALWYHNVLHHELYIVRWRLDPTAGEHVACALIQAAQAEAKKWNMSKVVIWNPEQSLADLLRVEIKPRDSSLSALGAVSPLLDSKNIEWVLNEKYATW